MEVLMNNLKLYRKAIGLTQKELAHLANCSPGAISHWESGKRQMTINTCRKMIDILGSYGFCTSMDQFVTSSTQPSSTPPDNFTSQSS